MLINLIKLINLRNIPDDAPVLSPVRRVTLPANLWIGPHLHACYNTPRHKLAGQALPHLVHLRHLWTRKPAALSFVQP